MSCCGSSHVGAPGTIPAGAGGSGGSLSGQWGLRMPRIGRSLARGGPCSIAGAKSKPGSQEAEPEIRAVREIPAEPVILAELWAGTQDPAAAPWLRTPDGPDSWVQRTTRD